MQDRDIYSLTETDNYGLSNTINIHNNLHPIQGHHLLQ